MAFQYEYLLLIPIGFIAGFLNTIAGGGTLLTLPALIFLGLPAPLANGTNRIAILIQTFTAVKGFKSKGISTYPFSLYLGVSAFLGSFIDRYKICHADTQASININAVMLSAA